MEEDVPPTSRTERLYRQALEMQVWHCSPDCMQPVSSCMGMLSSTEALCHCATAVLLFFSA